ncbi:MAG TPA: beta-galactosidase, partial [Streptosporangiaceae bacterium]|nr:beta-galactosidase [Streptosporangiaceae bacterium]
TGPGASGPRAGAAPGGITASGHAAGSQRRSAAVTRAGRAAAGIPVLSELRVRRCQRPLTGRWQQVPVEPRGRAQLGISFRPLQAQSLGLDPREALAELVTHPFEMIRLAAYWDRMEPQPGAFDPADLDWQVDAAERAGKQIIIGVGAVKNFGYPEFFVPPHRLPEPLREGSLVGPGSHPSLLAAATGFAAQVARRYRDRPAVIAWQVEHEAVDPLGLEHSWRLSARFAAEEVAAVRAADPGRPVLLNGFLPTSTPVRVMQWWRSRDQGDSLRVAQQLADIVGIDFYPRHAVASAGGRTLYLDGSRLAGQQRRWREALRWAAAAPGRRLMIAEGQAEPWEAVTTPPSPDGAGAYSCLPEDVIRNYNQSLRTCRELPGGAWAYLFWGAEYWLLRQQQGDPRYLKAFARVLAEAGDPPA